MINAKLTKGQKQLNRHHLMIGDQIDNEKEIRCNNSSNDTGLVTIKIDIPTSDLQSRCIQKPKNTRTKQNVNNTQQTYP